MIILKFNNDKKDKKKINVKVIATTTVAITLIGIVGISIGKYSGNNPINLGLIQEGIASIESSFNKGFMFLKGNFMPLIIFAVWLAGFILYYRDLMREAREDAALEAGNAKAGQ